MVIPLGVISFTDPATHVIYLSPSAVICGSLLTLTPILTAAAFNKSLYLSLKAGTTGSIR